MNRLLIRGTVKIMFFFVVLAASIEAQATVRRVPADHPTIQQAINASVNGDTVLVAPGTYVENIDFVGKAITVTSEAGPQTTIIDGNQANSVVTFHSGEGPASVISGFTLRNGYASAGVNANFEGGGINVKNGSSPTILRNVITNNKAAIGGGGIAVGFSSAIIQENTITANSQSPFFSGGFGGGGISVRGFSSALIIGNTISNNSWTVGGGITLVDAGPTVVRDNIISSNMAEHGGGIWVVNFSPAVIVNNLINGNRAFLGGGIYWSNAPDSVVNNTIVDNDSSQSSGIHASWGRTEGNLLNNIIVGRPNQTAVFCEGPSAPTFQFSNAFSPQGTSFGGSCAGQTGTNGNISADPLFVNQSGNDYHLLSNSPSVDSGLNSAPNIPTTDLEGKPRLQDGNGDALVVVDMGAYEVSLPFNICIQDDSNGSTLKFSSTTGDYQFTNCSGLTLSGRGTLTQRGGTITLQHYSIDRRVSGTIDTTVNRATAFIQLFSQGTTFTIIDRNTSNNTCACPGR